MARTYIYQGEADCLVPFTVDGPRVVSAGDSVRLADDDGSFEGHPLWEAGEHDAPPPAPVPEPGEVEEIPDPASEDHEISDPEQPASQEPTA